MSNLIKLIEGCEWTVLATEEVASALDGIRGAQKLRERGRLLRILERFADTPPGKSAFTDEQMKSEGRFLTGNREGRKVTVWAVKAYQSRLYGCRDGQCRRFILTAFDLGKKKNKADRSLLSEAARKFGEVTGL